MGSKIKQSDFVPYSFYMDFYLIACIKATKDYDKLEDHKRHYSQYRTDASRFDSGASYH